MCASVGVKCCSEPSNYAVFAKDQTSFAATDFRRGVYETLLTKIRLVLITRMAKPEEVLIVEDENGEEFI